MAERVLTDVFADEDVGLTLARMISGRGFNVLSARDAGRLGFPDPEQLAFAAERGLVLLTHNRDDFALLHTQWLQGAREHAGIIIVKRRLVTVVRENILRLLDQRTPSEFHNQIFYA